MARGIKHDANLKARFLAVVGTGLPVPMAAKRLNIPERTAYDWFAALRMEKGPEWDPYRDLLQQILGSQLRAILATTSVLEDEGYLRVGPNVSAIAIASGVLGDKAAQTVELWQRNPNSGSSPDLEGAATPGAVPGSPGD